MHPSRDSGVNFEVVPGPAHLKLRTPQAMSHFLGIASGGGARARKQGATARAMLCIAIWFRQAREGGGTLAQSEGADGGEYSRQRTLSTCTTTRSKSVKRSSPELSGARRSSPELPGALRSSPGSSPQLPG
eukprot:14513487-Alexandrium_andersonii.AAC.1